MKTLRTIAFIFTLTIVAIACAPVQTSTEISSEAQVTEQELLIPTQETEFDIIYKPIVHRPDW